jgi:hypothetical protein
MRKNTNAARRLARIKKERKPEYEYNEKIERAFKSIGK